jgi:hypothetical protein
MTPLSQPFLPGDTYFIVAFSDEKLAIPVVQTLIFEKTGTRDNGTRFFLFRYIPVEGAEVPFLVEEGQTDHLVLDQDGLLERLRDCFNN